MILLDENMKCEPLIYSETTAQFFGKEGIRWHGSSAFYNGGIGTGDQSLPPPHGNASERDCRR